MVDLNLVIQPQSQFHLFSAPFISDEGEIAALGRLSNGDMHAIPLLPCDENHAQVADCDYSEVAESASAIGVGSPPVEQGPTTANLWVSGTANPVMRFLGHRSMPWHRNPRVQPPQK